MKPLLPLLVASLLSGLPLASPAQSHDSEAVSCSACEGWNRPVDPFLLAPNTWYVGTRGLSAVLIDSGDGLILLDGALPQSASQIATNIRRLGFDLAQLRWILNSHAHFDHAGGIAALARWSGARVAASRRGAEALRLGDVTPDDPQVGYGAGNRYPAIPAVTVVEDGGTIQLGGVVVTAHYTPGHTPGSTAWTWQACDARGDCLDVVYADSLTAVSTPDFRFSDAPGRIGQFRASIDRVAALPCDVAISTHPEFVGLFERQVEGRLRDPEACRGYAQASLGRLQQRLARESSGS